MIKNTPRPSSGQAISKSPTTGMVVGASGIAAAAVGAYWLYGAKHAAKHRKMAKSWMLKTRAEVMEAVEKLENIDKTAYYQMVEDTVKKHTQTVKDSAAVALAIKEIKAAWPHIQKAVRPAKRATKKKK
ncbi:MAG: hypothetical protein CO183_00825 [Candidatus Zambryskibacteria bacterium CG_4_9_14_3_um_filter_42_9]|nr:MAG: hypothetical protein CO183_00825 [Candidatus Zambryskibacteria bacterium CG_4_9_14_3_um_filter_42_9]